MNLNVLDVMKLCMAAVVVAIHTNPENNLDWKQGKEAIRIIYTVAVPYFFMTSGFLLFKKAEFPLQTKIDKSRVRNYVIKIGRFYAIWTLLYLPMTIWGFAKEGTPFLKSVLIFVQNVLFVGENYSSWLLWYLLALIVAILIVYVCSSLRLKWWHILLFAILLHAFGLFLDHCRDYGLLSDITNVYYSIFRTTRNGFFIGLIYVVLGMKLAHLQSNNKKRTTSIATVGILIGFIGSVYRYPFADVLFAYSLFVLTLQIPINFLSITKCVYFRYLSMVIYLVHMYWVVLWSGLLPQSDMKSLGVFVLSLAFSILSGILLYSCKDKVWFKFCFQ